MNFLLHQVAAGVLPAGPHFVHCYIYEGQHCTCGGNYQGDRPGAPIGGLADIPIPSTETEPTP